MKKDELLLQIPDYRIKSVPGIHKSILHLGKLSCFITRLRQRIKKSGFKIIAC